jgi:hypothetical protein
MKILYRSRDGIEFAKKKECENHEKLLDKSESMAADKHFNNMNESSFANILMELQYEGKIKIL